jgi:3-oxoacyl-[acyl-carrier-protein] synthase II
MREVVITGIGMRTPMGRTLDEVRAVYRSGQPVVRRVEGPGGRIRAMARLPEDTLDVFGRTEQMMIDPVAQLSMLASDDAIADSGMALEAVDRDRIGVFVGTGQGTMNTMSDGMALLLAKDSVKTFTVLRGLNNGTSNHVSMRHKLRGECQTLTLACSSSNAAIGNAFRLIRDGTLDAALAGGSEAPHCEAIIRAWESLRVLAKPDPDRPETSSRPFSKNRTGLVLGEGAVLYMLESAEHAKARGARIYARLVGYGTSSDGANIAHPEAEGQQLALQACLRQAGLAPTDIDYINAHGTGTPTGDPVEAQAIRAVFGTHADRLAVSSTKSIHGHLLGAAGAIELLAPILALTDGLIAPTLNLTETDPACCGLDFVPNEARVGVKVRAVISSNFAFGGSNACLALAAA